MVSQLNKSSASSISGVMLDQEIDFSLQADYACCKAKRASGKVFGLLDGRKGIPVGLGISLYKSLVRLHLEYAVPAWASMKQIDVDKLEQTQVQCLRKIIGAKAHSSSGAVEVIAGIKPIRIRISELCCHESLRLRLIHDGHILKCLS